jgi:hypothetical protein
MIMKYFAVMEFSETPAAAAPATEQVLCGRRARAGTPRRWRFARGSPLPPRRRSIAAVSGRGTMTAEGRHGLAGARLKAGVAVGSSCRAERVVVGAAAVAAAAAGVAAAAAAGVGAAAVAAVAPADSLVVELP